MRYGRTFVGLALAFTLASVPSRTALAASSGTAVIAKINQLRKKANLPPIAAFADLTDDAETHSAAMARRGAVFHHPDLRDVTSGYTVLTQFEARAHTLSQALDGAVASAEHHKQIYGDYDRIGVGVSESGGFVYVTWFFMKTR